MEGDHAKKNKKTSFSIEGCLYDVGYVLHALWVRLFVQIGDGLNWLILDGRHYVLFNFRVLLALIYLMFQMVKE